MSVHVATEAPGGTRQIVTIDAHTLHADTTTATGGGTAPNPHDLFDTALATCKAITVALYARHKGIALDRIVVEIARDDAREKEGTYVLDVRLAFEGNLGEAEQKRLHEVAARCPVHKLMTTSTVEIRQAPLSTGSV
jgi:putative redox protein